MKAKTSKMSCYWSKECYWSRSQYGYVRSGGKTISFPSPISRGHLITCLVAAYFLQSLLSVTTSPALPCMRTKASQVAQW